MQEAHFLLAAQPPLRSWLLTQLLQWLRDNIHRHGSKFTPRELVQRVTGGEMDSLPYMRYLREKYSDIYSL